MYLNTCELVLKTASCYCDMSSKFKNSQFSCKTFPLVPHFIAELNPTQTAPGAGLCLVHSCGKQTLCDVVACSLVP